ncbi:hypothetical protein NP233_g11211 [Leucocoprinus birnbaumii]|uniref:Uncharacterized protein n=1 Tax=Leucocoprinus birnbaumii TaxID=56174 RepID=A0AAD5VGZ1_9AGAR|nr:hypothetical protein NP233_g11211 [Leucocoprinus birnbaumii]
MMDPSGEFACVVCYLEENQDPKVFYIKQNDGWLSFLDDEDFIRASRFPETKFDIFHNQTGEFMELGPDSVEWRFPSEKYSFFLLKKQSLTEDQCPKVDSCIVPEGGGRGKKRQYSEMIEMDAKIPAVNINVRVIIQGAESSVELGHTERRRKRSKRSKKSNRCRNHLGTGTYNDPINVDAI